MNKVTRKIVFVLPSLKTGGAENVLVTFANMLANSGFDVNIIFLVEEGSLLNKLDSRVKRWNLQNGSVYFSVFPILKLIKQLKPDIFFPWMGYLNAYLVFFKRIFPKGMRWICRESSIPSRMNSMYRFPFLFNHLYRYYNGYEKIICQSQYMAKDLRENFKVRIEKLAVINNPIDTSKLSDKLNEFEVTEAGIPGKMLLYVGGLNKWKRVNILLQLLVRLPVEYYLHIVGQGPELNTLEEFVRENHLQSRVNFIQGCQNPYPYYNKADCLLLCSSFEGFPNVIVEAMACGCPAIGFNIIGGANEVLSNYGGFIVDQYDLDSFAQMVRRVCEEEKINKNMIAEQCKEKYGLEKIMSEYLKVLS